MGQWVSYSFPARGRLFVYLDKLPFESFDVEYLSAMMLRTVFYKIISMPSTRFITIDFLLLNTKTYIIYWKIMYILCYYEYSLYL